MKKSVNGKSFEEIFEQRGEKSEQNKCKKAHFYLTIYGDSIWLCLFCKVKNGCLSSKSNLSISGNWYPDEEFDYSFNDMVIYEATPDQIALLNAYKNE